VLPQYRDAHVHVIRHQVPFHDLALLLLGQRMEGDSQLFPYLPEDRLAKRLFGTNTT
jgi:hypothetical protein